MTGALNYYTGRLGFEVTTVLPDQAYAIVERDDVVLHLFTAAPDQAAQVAVHIFVSDLDGLFDELESRGAIISQAIQAQPWGNRDFRVADSAGNTIKFTAPLG